VIESKMPPSDFVKLSVRSRLGAYKWWFWVLLIVGLFSAFLGVYRELNNAAASVLKTQLRDLPTFHFQQIVLAADTPASDAAGRLGGSASMPAELRPYVMAGIFFIIGTITLLSLGVTLFAQQEKKVTVASDLLKTCLGFFIGVATKLF